MIDTINQTITYEKEGKKMTNDTKFKGFDFFDTQYDEEAADLYGKDAVNTVKTNLYNGKVNEVEINNCLRDLGAICHIDPQSSDVQIKINEWINLLNSIYPYTADMLIGLAHLYTTDERFSRNINLFGDGLAEFMKEAMVYKLSN